MKQRDIGPKALELHDAALDSLHRIEALAGLLQSAAGSRDSSLDGCEIEEAAGIIREETTKLRDAFSLMRKWIDPAKPNGKSG